MTFLHPVFLWAAAVVSVPLVLHFMLRRKVKTIHFSTLRLLGLLSRKSSSSLRFNQWLLLLIRILIVLAIVFLFAQPLFTGLLSALNGSPGNVIYMVDNSHSMALRQPGKDSLYEKLIRKLESDISVLDPRTDVKIVALAPVAKVIASAKAAAFDVDSIVKPVYSSPDLKGALLIGAELSATLSVSDSAVRIYSDFQSRPWSPYLEKLSKLSLPVTMVPFVSDSYSNWAVSSIDVPQGRIVADSFFLLQVSLTWAGRDNKPPDARLTVKNRQGRLLASQIVSAPESMSPFVTVTVELPLQFQEEGVNRLVVEVQSPDDCIFADNSLDYAVDVSGERVAMLFNGAPALKAENDELFYLRHVHAGFKGPVTISEWGRDAIPELPEMMRAEVIHLASFAVDSERFSDNLMTCVESGCVVVCWGGDSLEIPVLNRYILDKFSSYKAMEIVNQNSSWYSEKSTTLDAGVVFSDSYIQELSTTRYLLLKSSDVESGGDESEAQGELGTLSGDRKEVVLAHYDDGTPAVMVRKIGRGAFVFVNATADVDWSNLPFHPVYPAFAASLQSLGNVGIETLSSGDIYLRTVPTDAGRRSIGELITPDGAKELVSPVLYGGNLAYACTNTWKPGLYSFSCERAGRRESEFFMVLPPSGGNSLSTIDVSLLDKGGLSVDLSQSQIEFGGADKSFGPEKSGSVQPDSDDPPLPGKSNESSFFQIHSTDLLLLFLSVLLSLEAFVVWRIGRTITPEQDA